MITDRRVTGTDTRVTTTARPVATQVTTTAQAMTAVALVRLMEEAMAEATDESKWPARRENIKLSSGSVIGVSVQSGVSDRQLREELFRVQSRIMRGHALKAYSIDRRRRTFKGRLATAWAYVEMYFNILARATWQRRKTEQAIAQLRKDLLGE